MQEDNSKPDRVFWLQGWEGKTQQGRLYRSDIVAYIKLQEEYVNGEVVGIKLYEKSAKNNSYTVQFIVNTGNDVPTSYENREEMKKEFDNKHGTTAFVEGKLFKEDMHSGPELRFNPDDIKKGEI